MGKVTAPGLREFKTSGRKIVCVTAYDLVSGAICDAAGADVILVGDSLGNVILGFDTTIPVTLDHMVHHVGATQRGVKNALLVGDLPFGSYTTIPKALDSAAALMKAGAEAVKLEGRYPEVIAECARAGIPVMGHVGFTPQSVHSFGGFKVQGKGKSADQILKVAKELDEAGAIAIVLELIPAELSRKITEAVSCPTIGIGAGIHCDGEIQVFHDVMGLTDHQFKHTKRYVEGKQLLLTGMTSYVQDVRDGKFPTDENSH